MSRFVGALCGALLLLVPGAASAAQVQPSSAPHGPSPSNAPHLRQQGRRCRTAGAATPAHPAPGPALRRRVGLYLQSAHAHQPVRSEQHPRPKRSALPLRDHDAAPAYEEFSTQASSPTWSRSRCTPRPPGSSCRAPLDPNTWLPLTGALQGEDGELWYRTDDGDYVPEAAPSSSPDAPRTFHRPLDRRRPDRARACHRVRGRRSRSLTTLTIHGAGNSPDARGRVHHPCAASPTRR